MSKEVPQRGSMVRNLSTLGIIGPVLYTSTWLVLGFLDSAHSHIRDPVSNLSGVGAPYTAIMTSVIILFALFILGFSVALHLGFRQGFWSGPATMAVAAIGFLGIAFSPVDLSYPESAGDIHLIFASVTIFALILTPVLMLPKLQRNSEWNKLRGYSVVTTVLAFLCSLLVPLPSLASLQGLLQRLVLVIVFVWMMVIAVCLYKSQSSESHRGLVRKP